MSIKVKKKKYKNSPDITSNLYTDRIKKFKFKANIFEENGILSGETEGYIGSYPEVSREDYTLDGWIKEYEEIFLFYKNYVKFLKQIKHLNKKQKKTKK